MFQIEQRQPRKPTKLEAWVRADVESREETSLDDLCARATLALGTDAALVTRLVGSAWVRAHAHDPEQIQQWFRVLLRDKINKLTRYIYYHLGTGTHIRTGDRILRRDVLAAELRAHPPIWAKRP